MLHINDMPHQTVSTFLRFYQMYSCWPLYCYNYHCHKMLSYRKETALQGTLVLAKSGRLELGDNILRTL